MLRRLRQQRRAVATGYTFSGDRMPHRVTEKTLWRRIGTACSRLRTVLCTGSVAALLNACSSGQLPVRDAASSSFRIAVFGDMPYARPALDSSVEQVRYRQLLDHINHLDVVFVVHVGDFTGSNCSDEIFLQRLHELGAMRHPVVYTPGDNEWTDCAEGGYEPEERLGRLRELFTASDSSLGHRRIAIRRQSDDSRFTAYRENVRWQHGGVLFMTLHMVGSNNNRGAGTTPTDEFVERNAANLQWLRDTFKHAEDVDAVAIAIFTQANPHLEGTILRPRLRPDPDGFAEVVAELRTLVMRYGQPVAFVHGDTHYFRVDKPLWNEVDRQIILNFTRAETFGWPNLHGLLMSVDPGDPLVFRFDPLIVPGALTEY